MPAEFFINAKKCENAKYFAKKCENAKYFAVLLFPTKPRTFFLF